MCQFCPVEIKSSGLGAGSSGGPGGFCWFCSVSLFCFTDWQRYIGKTDKYGFCKTAYDENMRKHNCVWGPASWYFPVKNKPNQNDLRFELGKLCIPKDFPKDI